MSDHEGAPAQIKPAKLNDYLEVMSKAVFQSGISWAVVDKKWPGIRDAFEGFDPGRISNLRPDEIDRLIGDPRIIRNRRKVEGIVHNARTMLDLDRAGGFSKYLRSQSDFDELSKDLRKRFKFLGDHGIYYFLWVVSEPVPPYEEWVQTHGSRRAQGAMH
ncbi:MAG TPA: DNA-3-methyladenine glycosylase I [Dehalococcoidia bacterium]